jgi:hypothetical protein
MRDPRMNLSRYSRALTVGISFLPALGDGAVEVVSSLNCSLRQNMRFLCILAKLLSASSGGPPNLRPGLVGLMGPPCRRLAGGADPDAVPDAAGFTSACW